MVIQYENSCLPCIFIAILQISRLNKELCHQSKLLPVPSKINKSRYQSSLNDCAFSSLLTFLALSCFIPVSFDIGDVSNNLMNAHVILFIWK